MARIEELPDDFDVSLDLNRGSTTPSPQSNSTTDAMLSQAVPFPTKAGAEPPSNPSESSAAMPPAMAATKQHSADEVLNMMNRTPLFMTSLEDTDGEGGENIELEAIKALAYEGTRAEVAANFREQGNEQARLKRWTDAKEFYDKALAALKGPIKPQNKQDGPADMEVAEIDEETEKRKEAGIEEACYVNRALCNLEKKNYRSCNLDCAAALRMNPINIKAWYRSASACLALGKVAEAEDACNRGLEIDSQNTALKTLLSKILERKEQIEAVGRQRCERAKQQAAEEHALKLALNARNIRTRTTGQAPNMEDATIKLDNPLDASSVMSLPVILLYPLDMQSDFIKAFRETETLGQHLSYILPLPWDQRGEYTPESVECYAETVSGGLTKAGKKLPLLKLLNSGKVEVIDGLLRINVVPKAKASAWIEEFKKRKTA